MKKRIRKTGEIVDVIDYYAFYRTERDKEDWVSFVDSKGEEHTNEHGLNIYWDFEDVEEELTKEIDWEEVRINAAIAFESTMISSDKWNIPRNAKVEEAPECYANAAISYADALIAKLKKGGDQ